MSEQDATLEDFVTEEEPGETSEESKDVWLGPRKVTIPRHWDVADLDEIGNIVTGDTPSTDNEAFYGQDFPFVTPEDLRENEEVDYIRRGLSEEGLKESRPIPAGSVMMDCIGSDMGKVALAKRKLATNQQINSIVPNESVVNSVYFKYQLQSISDIIRAQAGSTTTPILNKGRFSKSQILLAPLVEQRKIASALYNVDQAIQKTEEIIDQTHRVKSGVSQDVFHGKHKKHKQYISTPVGEVPEHWDVVSIGDVVHTAQYGISESLSEEGKYPIFRMNNVENGYMIEEPMKYIDLNDDEFEKYCVEEGDILFNRTNSLELVGKTGIYQLKGDHVFASYLIRLQTDEKADSYFLNYYMNSTEAQNRMMDFATKGVSQANINANSIQQIKLPLPPLEEQRQIAKRIRSIDEKIEANEQYKSQLRRFKQGLMQDLLSGTVPTTDTHIEVLPEVEQYG